MLMNIVLAAGESAGVEMLRVLARSRHSIVGVLATRPQKGTAASSVWKVAQQLGYETWPAERLKDPDFADHLRSQPVDLLLNVHSLHIIHEKVLAVPRLGAFNLHPGPLPRYAGLNPVSWAIFNGEKEHGVTVHRMDAGVDTGPIAFQTIFPIADNETALSVTLKCMREGIELMSRTLPAAENNSIPAIPQNLAERRYFGRQVPENGQFSWSWPAEKVINFVRACDYFPFDSPWGHPRTCQGVQEFALVKASRTGRPSEVVPGTIGESTDSGVYVACQDEWILVSKLRIEDRCLPAVGFLRAGEKLRTIRHYDDERGSAKHNCTTDQDVCGDAGGSALG